MEVEGCQGKDGRGRGGFRGGRGGRDDYHQHRYQDQRVSGQRHGGAQRKSGGRDVFSHGGEGEESGRGGYGRREWRRSERHPYHRHYHPYRRHHGQGHSGAQGYLAAGEDSSYGGRDGWSSGRGEKRRGGESPQQQHYHHQDERVSGQSWAQETPVARQGFRHDGEDVSDRVGYGGRGGGERGIRGRSTAASYSQAGPDLDRSSPAPDPVPNPIIRDMQTGRIPEQVPTVLSSPENMSRTIPVKRPDKGGQLCIRTVRLHVNHFPVRFNPHSIIRHYDIDVKPAEPKKNDRPEKISKSDLSEIRDKLFMDNPSQFPLSMTAYDGEKNIFSAVNLPEGKFMVQFSEGEDMKHRTYEFSIKLVSELKLCKLRDYLSRNLFSIPRDILQGMDVVIKEKPAKCMIPVGRSFHFAEHHADDDLGLGITVSRGIQYSLKPTVQGLALCLDYSVLAFRKRMPVLDFLMEHIRGFDLNNFNMFRREVEQALKNLKVTVTHRITKQKYTIVGLTREKTRDLCFPLVDTDEGNAAPRPVFLVDYFREKHGRNILYLDIPCLNVSRSKRVNYLPMEFCVLAEGQIYPKEVLENLDEDRAGFLKRISLVRPKERARRIRDMVRSSDGPCSGEIIQNFGIEIDKNMTSVFGRVIGPPMLKLAATTGKEINVSVDKERCHWNLVGKAVVEGRAVERWAVLDFTENDRFQWNRGQFVRKLIAKCRSLGMKMGEHLFYHCTVMKKLSNIDVLRELLEGLSNQAYKTKGHLQILICVMTRKDEGYKYLKWISETILGLVTQCCLSNNIAKKGDQYLSNLALKINAKLGGSNVELIDRLPYFRGDSSVMFVGADVNHPGSRNKTSPSIAAVVATVNWPAANRYAARVRPQEHRKEKILHFGEMCLDLVRYYAFRNKVKPEKIVIFRDGVSEGQFDMVLNEELVDLKKAFLAVNYNPTITLIVAQKRHQTRLFPENERDGNVPPGTVVDTTIVHPFEFDFYLCSHYGNLGTSKPTHYYVLWDEHGISSDELQQLIYNLCFTFSRCTKPVSLVPPVYYADLVAYRGRMYHEAVIEGQSSASTSFDERFFKLHTDLENAMFFV
ncbi:hypothetical protein SLE2022_386510 [Rubroshorea leprosula]